MAVNRKNRKTVIVWDNKKGVRRQNYVRYCSLTETDKRGESIGEEICVALRSNIEWGWVELLCWLMVCCRHVTLTRRQLVQKEFWINRLFNVKMFCGVGDMVSCSIIWPIVHKTVITLWQKGNPNTRHKSRQITERKSQLLIKKSKTKIHWIKYKMQGEKKVSYQRAKHQIKRQVCEPWITQEIRNEKPGMSEVRN